jgi:Zn-dependent peptidase ImmA (M78 family)
MTQDAIKAAKNAARDLISKSSRKAFAFTDVHEIARSLNIKILEGEFRDNFGRNISGLMKVSGKDGKPIIAIKSSDSEERKRFTIAHEIGHFVLHGNELAHVDPDLEAVVYRDKSSAMATNTKEIQANQFAAELLMPTDEINTLMLENQKSDKDITKTIIEISEKYRVSSLAATIKVTSLLNTWHS